MAEGFNYLDVLKEMYPRVQENVIRDIIDTVLTQSLVTDTIEHKIENMINLLSNGEQSNDISNLLGQLIIVYPDVEENYLREFIESKPCFFDIEDAIDELNNRVLPMRRLDETQIKEQLQSALPNADPDYLETEAQKLSQCNSNALSLFIQNAVDKNDYPTMQDYLKRKKLSDEASLYKENFSVKTFLELIPNPEKTFSKFELILDENSNEIDAKYAINFLYNHYKFIRKRCIDLVLKLEKNNLPNVCNRLDNLCKGLRKARSAEFIEIESNNVKLLQFIAYMKHRKQINKEVKLKNDLYRQAVEEARKYDLLETCQCCYDDELIPEECYFCTNECVFCKSCVQKGVEVAIGKGDTKFPCLSNCDAEFNLHTLRMILSKNMFDKVSLKVASEQIKLANVDGLETCPFCEFAMVLPENEKIFKCANEDCGKESCRLCRHESHVPLRCNDIEYDEDVKRRTYIENKMTEALTRTCFKCKKPFIKSNGCNKMTCVCGAKMCYLCGEGNIDYKHFNPNRCPLFINDVEEHLNRVKRGAQNAKNDLGDVEIKFDPTTNIEEFFKEG